MNLSLFFLVRQYRRGVLHGMLLAMALAATTAQAEPLRYNLVNLEAQATGEATTDRMQAMVALELNGGDLARLARQANERLQKALDLLQHQKAVQYGSTGYQTEPVYSYPEHASPRQTGWRITAILRLHSPDTEAMGKLLGQLQTSGFAVQGLDFILSRERREQLESQLVVQGLQAFRARAEQVSQALDGKGYRIVQLRIQTDSPPQDGPVFHRRMRAMAAEAAPLPAAPAQQEMTVQINGQIEIRGENP
jgi:predicted secreted protein